MSVFTTRSYAALESTRMAYNLFRQVEIEALNDTSQPTQIRRQAAFVNLHQAILILFEHRRVGIRNANDVDLLFHIFDRTQLWTPQLYVMDGVPAEAVQRYAVSQGFTVVNNTGDELCPWESPFNPVAANPAVDIPAAANLAAANLAAGITAAANPAAGIPTAANPAAGILAAANPAAGNPAAANPAAANPAAANPAGIPAAANPAAAIPAAANPAAGIPAAANPAAGIPAAANPAAANPATANEQNADVPPRGRGRGLHPRRQSRTTRRRAGGGLLGILRQFIGS